MSYINHLPEDQWGKICEALPGKDGDPGCSGEDNRRFVEAAALMGAGAVFPPKCSRKTPRPYDANLYKERNLIERLLNKLRQFKRIATHYDKNAESFLAFIHITAACIWLNGRFAAYRLSAQPWHKLKETGNSA